MGCDIHIYTEYKVWAGDKKGQWFNCDDYRLNPYFGEDEGEYEYDVRPIYKDRNYTLFSILANVRNYGDNEPIDLPRGLPDDCCQKIREESNLWGSDGHSHSYFTLKELTKWRNEHLTITCQGYVSLESAWQLEEEGIYPEEYWQGGNIPGQVWKKWEKPNKTMDKLISSLENRAKEVFWIFSDDDKRLQEIADKIRIVFWFDN